LKVYNTSGEEVVNLADDTFSVGMHSFGWDASEFPSGIYLYCIEAEDFVNTKKMLYIK